MTLDRDKPRRNNRKPMGRTGTIITIVVAVAVLAFVVITLAVTGQSFF